MTGEGEEWLSEEEKIGALDFVSWVKARAAEVAAAGDVGFAGAGCEKERGATGN